MADQNVPMWINGYEVANYISSGSFAEAYQVKYRDHIYVLKWLKSDAPAGGDSRFKNEGWALEQLSHSAIPSFVASGVSDGRPYIVMSLAPGRSLRKRLTVPVGERGTFGETWVLRILSTLLDAICHSQSRGITHRDIKDDNVVCDDLAEKVTLIDFGFCKGNSQPVDADSFYQVGAPRYSPPSKLRFPSVTHPTHDVFAIGVLAYFLLTDRYPWSVPADQDHGFLSALMDNTIPPSVTDLNSAVSYDTAQFVASLLNIDDNRRPTSRDALQQVRDLLKAGHSDLKFPSHYTGLYPKVLRDPVYGDVRMTKLEAQLVDTAEFQRLRLIKQLGFASLVFSGAEHTRLSHSIGTMYAADRITQSVAETSGVKIDPEERLLIRCYALVHDIGHVPFGHTLEDELGFFKRHDNNVSRMNQITNPQSEIYKHLEQSSFGRVIIDELQNAGSMPSLALARDVVDGHAGADVLDYVNKDSLYCGVDHKVDDAIYRHYRFVPIAGAHSRPVKHLVSKVYGSRGLRLDASFAVESLLLQRYALFLKIYTHITKCSAGAMLGKALQYIISSSTSEEVEQKILHMGDHELLLWMRSNSGSPFVHNIAERLINRRLYKLAYVTNSLTNDNLNMEAYRVAQESMSDFQMNSPTAREATERELASRTGLGEEQIITYWPENAPGLQRVRHYFQDRPGQTPSAAMPASITRMIERHLGLWRIMIFTDASISEDKRKIVGQAGEAFFGMPNQATLDWR